jgi:hypothetical protein
MKQTALHLDEDCQWLTVSLFCPKENWGRLFEHIDFFVQEKNEQFFFYHLQINDNNGPNLRLSFLIPAASKQQVGDDLNSWFKTFLFTLSKGRSRLKIDSIFLPYPTYVIEFDLYHLNYDARHLPRYKVRQEITEIIIQVLQTEDVDMETITTLSFYFQISLIKTILMHREMGFIKFFSSTRSLTKTVASIENIQILQEITTDVMLTDLFETELQWLNRWIAFCKTSLSDHLDQNDDANKPFEYQLQSFYNYFVAHIHEALDISAKSKAFLDYAVNRSTMEYLEGTQSPTKLFQKA